MNVLLGLLILAAPPAPHSDHLLAETVAEWSFEAEDDANFDLWPDHWTRRRGKGFPAYAKVEIRDEPLAVDGDRHLHLQLNGGSISVFSKPFRVSPLFSYVLEGYVRTDKLEHDVTYFELQFLDHDGKVIERHRSQRLQQVDAWTKLRLGPIAIANPDVQQAVVGLHLTPEGKRGDLFGSARFDKLWVGRLPRMQLQGAQPFHIFAGADEVRVDCEVSGITDSEPRIQFELLDHLGQTIARQEQAVEVKRLSQHQQRLLTALHPMQTAPDEQLQDAYSGTASWQPPVPDLGFYTVRAVMQSSDETPLERSIQLVVVDAAPPAEGPFGWTLPRGEQQHSLQQLAGMLANVGIRWVKFPVWYDEADVQRADELAWLAERLGSSGIRMVGILDQPPKKIRDLYTHRGQLPVASVFLEPALWHAAVDPVMTRLSLKVQWWQLGADDDTSYVGFPSVEKNVRDIRSHLERFGQEIHLGLPWRWLSSEPDVQPAPWDFLSMTVDPPFTAEELARYVESESPSEVSRWVMLKPLSSRHYSLETRARDLVTRMLTASRLQATGIFLPDPFDAECGVMHPDGQPNDLLLPWRTTARMVGGAQYIGQLRLPNDSPNMVFARGNEALMVVWNDAPTQETMYLGDDVRQVDLWGRSQQPENMHGEQMVRQQVQVGRLPTFVTGINLQVARWRMGVKFEKRELSSAFGRQQRAAYRFQNWFAQGVGGYAVMHTPKVWEVDPLHQNFKLARGDEQQSRFNVLLRADASTGEQPVRIDFHVTADRTYRFSVYRTMQVGLGDLLIELNTSLDAKGDLIVEQVITNKTDEPVSFNCLLFVPDRRRERKQVFYLGRGRATTRYVLPKGDELLGKMLWLRAEEINGNRILNYSVQVEP